MANDITFDCVECQLTRYYCDRPELVITDDVSQTTGEALAAVLNHVHAIAQGGSVSRETIEALTKAYEEMIDAASKDQEEND